MPKVTTKDGKKPLQEAAPAAMDVGEELPSKPMFSALTAKEQNGMKVEFRRVSMHARGRRAERLDKDKALPSRALAGGGCWRHSCWPPEPLRC
jgi:hypothetical protein